MVSYSNIISHQALLRTKAPPFCLINDLLNNINCLRCEVKVLNSEISFDKWEKLDFGLGTNITITCYSP